MGMTQPTKKAEEYTPDHDNVPTHAGLCRIGGDARFEASGESARRGEDDIAVVEKSSYIPSSAKRWIHKNVEGI